MSFSFYLLWLINILMILSAVFICYAWLKESWKEHPILVTIAYVLLSIGSIMAGIYSFLDQTGNSNSYLELTRNLSLICGSLGLLFFFVGGYIKVKYDPYRKKMSLLPIYVLVTIIVSCGLGIVFIDLYYK